MNNNGLHYAIFSKEYKYNNKFILEGIYPCLNDALSAASFFCEKQILDTKEARKKELTTETVYVNENRVDIDVMNVCGEMDQLLYQCRIMPINENIVIFGYSLIGRMLGKHLWQDAPNLSIIYCDNSTAKQGLKDNGDMVYAVETVVKLFPYAQYRISSLYHAEQMRNQLIGYGIPSTNIIDKLPKVIEDFAHREEVNFRTTPREKFRFEVNINKHCNLKCKGCDHFAPVADKDFMNLSVYRKDMERLAELFHGEAWQIHLLGGEPLLNPKLISYMEIARVNFPKAEILIDTNGLLLGKMDESFWEACRKNHIIISPTKYPIDLDYDVLQKLVCREGIRYQYLGSSESGRTLWHFPLDLTGKQDINESFVNCRNANQCLTLEAGRLYTCSIAPNIKAFNAYFNKHLELTKDDGIDIYNALSKEEVLAAMARPMPFCRYCDVKHRTYDHPWEISQKNIKEWT